MLGKIIKYLFWGISWGCTFFVMICLTGVLTAGKAFIEPIINDFVRQALGAVLAGILCGSTSIIYTNEKLPFGICILIHFAAGLTGYFGIAFKLGWIPLESGWHILGFSIFGILTFIGIWSGFYFYNRHDAKKVNNLLKELENNKNNSSV